MDDHAVVRRDAGGDCGAARYFDLTTLPLRKMWLTGEVLLRLSEPGRSAVGDQGRPLLRLFGVRRVGHRMRQPRRLPYPMADCYVEIVDRKTGQVLEPGEIGEIVVTHTLLRRDTLDPLPYPKDWATSRRTRAGAASGCPAALFARPYGGRDRDRRSVLLAFLYRRVPDAHAGGRPLVSLCRTPGWKGNFWSVPSWRPDTSLRPSWPIALRASWSITWACRAGLSLSIRSQGPAARPCGSIYEQESEAE